jgi:hypothetical protein
MMELPRRARNEPSLEKEWTYLANSSTIILAEAAGEPVDRRDNFTKASAVRLLGLCS